jgi:hypothetical protein
MKISIFFCSLLFGALAISSPYSLSIEESSAQKLLQSIKSRTIPSRLDEVTSKYFAKPYLSYPLGEGPLARFDQGPRFRFDGFDCTTFVETMSAAALSRNLKDFEILMDKIRYQDSFVAFQTRNHFTDLDWIPNNIQAGIITDITKRLFGSRTKTATALIEKDIWYANLTTDRIKNSQESQQVLLDELRKLGQLYLPKEASVPYVSIRDLTSEPALLDKIPSGSIINIVRPNWNLRPFIGTNMNISHQGFAIRKRTGVLYFRHASTELHLVTEEPMADYLNRMLNVKSIGGLNILTLRDQR